MSKVKPAIGIFSFFALFLLSPHPSFAVNLDRMVEEIKIEGLDRAEPNTVKYYIHSKEGRKYSGKTVQEDIRRLFKLGYFDNIEIDVDEIKFGLVVTYRFTEKPFVRNITFSNANVIKEDTLKVRIKTKKGNFFRQGLLPWDKLRIKQAYRNKGHYFSEVETVVSALDGNLVDIEYKIDEGKKITISDIRFRGNKVFSDRTIEEEIESSDMGIFSFLSDSGAYKKDVLKTDLLRIESFYHDNGYIKVKTKDPTVEIDRETRGIIVTFEVEEGDQYRLGKLNIKGDDVYSESELKEAITLKEGDVFNRTLFRKDIFTLTDQYSQKGYAYANVLPSMIINEDTKTVDATITTNKGRRVYVGKINIRGNEETRDNVIRRQFLLHEGELFNSAKLRVSRQKVQRLGFFESVEIEQRSRREEDLINVDVNVTERNTGQISFAVGYSSLEKLLFQGQVKWTNLMGRGQEFALTADYSERRDDYSISFTEPALFDRELMGGADIYNKTFEFDAYESRKTGASVRTGRGFGPYLWLRVGYKLEETDVTLKTTEDDDGNEVEADVSPYLREQEGGSTAGSIYPSITYDTRNDRFNPTSGYRLYAYYERSGFGGEERWYRAIGEYTHYKTLFGGFVGMFHAKIGNAHGYDDHDLPITHRFFLGGPTSLRGFTMNDVGPLDENGEPIGGEGLLLFNAELQYRFTDFFRGFVFYDRGNVYGSNDELGNTTADLYNLTEMRHAAGMGIHFFSPMGPMTLAYGYKLDQKEGETPSEFHFTIGGAF